MSGTTVTERWFFVEDGRRRGPLPFDRLLEVVLARGDPRAVLVWRRGFAEWTRAEDVPEMERRIAPLLHRTAPHGTDGATVASQPRAAGGPAPARHAGHPLALGILAVALLLGLAGLWAWRRQTASAGVPPAPGADTAANAPAVVLPGPPSRSAAAATGSIRLAAPRASAEHRTAGVGDEEGELPASELKKLRGVAAWSGETLTLTVYNGTAWRVTELSVRIGRFAADDFVEDPQPLALVPPGRPVDAPVADLLQQVAPDRKRPGLNPLDTGAFQGRAGAVPESFRWEIEAARGYPPRQ